MAKLGISFKIDVTKIDKSRLFQGEKGIYLNMTAFIDTKKIGQYGDHGVINQSTTQEERADGMEMPIIGNVKVFFSTLKKESKSASTPAPSSYKDEPNDVIPF